MPRTIPDLPYWQRTLAQSYGEAGAARLAAQVQNYYDELYASRPHPGQLALRTHLENVILPGLALYQTLRRAGCDAPTAVGAVEDLFEAAYQARHRWQMLWMSRMPFLFDLIRLTIGTMMSLGFPHQGWQTVWVENSRDRIAFNIYRCFYLDTLRAYGAPELTRAFCASDDFMMTSFLNQIRWERTTTLGRGGSRCDFCYRRVTPQHL